MEENGIMRLVIRNGALVSSDTVFKETDLLIENGKITKVGRELQIAADEYIDATDKWVLPGGIDVHTHLEMPLRDDIWSSDDFYSGTVAAAYGGTTTIIDFPTQVRGKKLSVAVSEWMQRAKEKSVVDFGFHGIVTDVSKATVNDMARAFQNGITSFKFFMAYPGSLMMSDTDLFKAFRTCSKLGALPMVHAENGVIIEEFIREALDKERVFPIYHAKTRPPLTESDAICRAAHLANLAGSPVYIVHLSTREGLQAIVNLRKMRMDILTETCPHYLLLNETAYLERDLKGAKYVMSPPLRPESSPPALRYGLLKGEIEIVATDHCPFPLSLKRELAGTNFTKIPNGGPGIETRLLLLYHFFVATGKMTPSQWVSVTSTQCAKTFGLYPQKGTFLPGADADCIVFDPKGQTSLNAEDLHMNVDYSPYQGLVTKGKIETVISRGDIIITQGRCTAEKGRGQFLPRRPFRR
ncbi:MAG: dihydropyrimidinase [Acidobacteria bacterium]|nr:MAG: dihydropyrimidinase [Acidobacteriota bacterium]